MLFGTRQRDFGEVKEMTAAQLAREPMAAAESHDAFVASTSKETTKRKNIDFVEERGIWDGLRDALGLGDDQMVVEEDEVERAHALDPKAKYMPGACLEKHIALRPPDLEAIRESRNEGVEWAYENIVDLQHVGKLGDAEVAQPVLDYMTALAGNAEDVVQMGDVLRHVIMVRDLLNFYPLCVDIHLWALEALMALYTTKLAAEVDGVPSAVFEAVSQVVCTHHEDPRLVGGVAMFPYRLLAALALTLTPATSKRLIPAHLDFTLRVVHRNDAVGQATLEHALQVMLVSRVSHRLAEQGQVATTALTTFRSSPKLVTRALLVLHTLFSIVSDSGDADALKALLNSTNEGGKLPVGLRQIIMSMDLYAQDRKVQGAGMLALSGAVRMTDAFYGGESEAKAFRAMNRDGLLRSMVYAQQHHRKSRSVALNLCHVVQVMARREPKLLTPEVVLSTLDAGLAFMPDEEVALLALETAAAMAPRFGQLCEQSKDLTKLVQLAGDLVHMAEHHHKNTAAVAALLVTFAAAASDGTGAAPGGSMGEQWREALGRVGAVAIPFRAFYEHPDDAEIVCAGAIAVRCLTYDNQVSRTHAGQLRAASVILSALQKHARRPDTARELLAALANCGAEKLVRDEYARGMPDTAEVIYIAMTTGAKEEPDVVGQGCRALAALSDQETIREGNWNWEKIKVACKKAVKRVLEGQGQAVATHNLYGDEVGTQEFIDAVKKLQIMCNQILSGTIASCPQFGRILDMDCELLLQNLRAHHSRIPASRESSAYYKGESLSPRPPTPPRTPRTSQRASMKSDRSLRLPP